MRDPDQFTKILNKYVQRSAYTPGQLAGLSSLPKTTIVNWLQGRVQRPRAWQGIVELAVAMRLSLSEANELLDAARQSTIAERHALAKTDAERTLLSFWETRPPAVVTPFQAVPLSPYFVGREAELAEVRLALTKGRQTAVCLLYGMAGVGKTSVAAQLAYQLREHFADGVLWARLDSSDTMAILATFAQAYQQDVSQYHDVASRSRVVRNLLTNKQTLIVLDNAQTSEQIEPLLPPTGRCRVIVTTRQQNLAILAGAKRLEIRPFSPNQTTALTLFTQILGEARVQQSADLLNQIAADLGYLPLALVIVASRLAYESGWQIGQFQQRLRRVSQRLRTLQYETQSVRRSFQLSYDLLDDDTQKLFAALGRLARQSFSSEVVAAVAGVERDVAEDGLRRLHSLSLLEGGENGRYQLHPLLHDFAHSLPALPAVQQRLVTYLVDFAAANRYEFGKLAREMGHLKVGVETAVQEQLTKSLGQLLNYLSPFLLAQGRHALAQTWLTQAQKLLAQHGDLQGQSWLLLRLGQLERQRQLLDKAETYLQASLEMAQNLEDAALIATTLTELGIICNCRSHYEQGMAYLNQALPLARQLPTPECLPDLLEELGILTLMAGDYEQAEQHYAEGLEVARGQNRQTQAVMCLKGLGALRYLAQDYEAAQRLFLQGYGLAEQSGFRKGLMVMDNNLGVVAHFLGKRAEAEAHLLASQTEAERLNDFPAQRLILLNLARFMWKNGRFALARTYFIQLLALAEVHDWNEMAEEARKALAELAREGTEKRPLPKQLKVFI
ncbi:MAG: NB-ARC domain-containing protein [Chloroflexota bacterium]